MISQIFSPKYKKFYGYFEDMSNQVESLTSSFCSYLKSPSVEEAQAHAPTVISKADNLKKTADDTLKYLEANFITPFDREDIVILVNGLEKIAVHMKTGTRRLEIYKLFPADDITNSFADIIHLGVEKINKNIHRLRNSGDKKKILADVELIYNLESQGDELYNEGLRLLLEADIDFKTFFKTKDIYQKLELITDEMEDIAKVLEAIMIKYA